MKTCSPALTFGLIELVGTLMGRIIFTDLRAGTAIAGMRRIPKASWMILLLNLKGRPGTGTGGGVFMLDSPYELASASRRSLAAA